MWNTVEKKWDPSRVIGLVPTLSDIGGEILVFASGVCYSRKKLYTLDGTWFPIFRQVQDNYRFGQKRHTDPASYHKDPNPTTLAPCLLWLSTVSQSSWPHHES
jgi:hypothetical protein